MVLDTFVQKGKVWAFPLLGSPLPKLIWWNPGPITESSISWPPITGRRHFASYGCLPFSSVEETESLWAALMVQIGILWVGVGDLGFAYRQKAVLSSEASSGKEHVPTVEGEDLQVAPALGPISCLRQDTCMGKVGSQFGANMAWCKRRNWESAYSQQWSLQRTQRWA